MEPAIPVLRARILDDPRIVAGFSTRDGGVSEAPFDGLNLSSALDDPGVVAENTLRFCRAVGLLRCPPALQRQVHGRTVTWVGGDDGPSRSEVRHREGDALVTRHAGVGVAVLVADCVPVLLWDPPRGVVAAVHAGWRGTAEGIVGAALEAMGERAGTEPADVRAALGPSIGGCCYRVGPEVVEALRTAVGEDGLLASEEEAPRVDLRAVNRVLLQRCGLPAEQIEDVGGCTCCGLRLFSYRRDGLRTGRLMGVIELR